jgi:hypothetical protein
MLKAYAYIPSHCPKRNRLGPERAPKLVRVHYNLRLRRKRSNPEYEDGHLPAMTIDPIDEAADDLIVEVTRTQITCRKLKAGGRCAGHNPGHSLSLRRFVDSESESEAGRGVPLNSESRSVTVTSLSRGQTFHPRAVASVGQWAPGAVTVAHWQGARDCQGLWSLVRD